MKNIFLVLKDSFSILVKKEKKNYFLIVFLTIISTILETVGIALIFTFLTIVISGGLQLTIPFINLNFGNIKSDSINSILILMIFLYLFKSIYLSIFYWYQTKYVNDVEANISKKLLSGYLALPLNFHLNINTAELIRNISVESGQFAGSILHNSLEFFKNIFLLVFLIGFLIILSPTLTFSIIFGLLIFATIFQLIMSKKNSMWGKNRQIFAGDRIKKLQEALQGIKTIKVFNKEVYFFKRFEVLLYKINLIRLKQTFFKNFPRIWLEFILVLGFATSIIFFFDNKQIINHLPILGTAIVILVRLMPATISLINNIQHFDFSTASLYKIKADFISFEKNQNIVQEIENLKFENEIIFEDISYKYAQKNTFTLKNINFSIKKNSSIGIFGSSGAGKSTLLNLILGLFNPTEGKIKIDNIEIKKNFSSLRNLVGYVPQDIFIIDDSIKNNIQFGYSENDDQNSTKLLKVINESGLSNLISSLKEKENTNIGEVGGRLSGGEKQRISIARAILKNPEILIFDEATKSLDKFNQDQINKLIKSFFKSKTIINVTHDLESLKGYDVVYKIENGSLIKITKI
jgi:ABC-type multidrug transport system fused ATPase/permease subunit